MPSQLAQLARQGKINQTASIRDKQSILIHAPIQTIWDLLVNTGQWAEWNTEIKKTSGELLSEGSSFTWKSAHTTIKSTVRAFKSPYLLSWTGHVHWIKAIHVWSLEESDENETIVTVEESMQGLLLPFFFNHQKLHGSLVKWLDHLKARAEKKPV
ncbi:MAG: SRPBCC domain-containing protein [Cyclobacteriaceae bacterium]|nr:SRPBCC domain-containing protein [Cyclobacteriaceae bacterium]